MAFNTGNPLGSTDPRDLSDNSENFDDAVNNTASATWTDRFGNTRTSIAGQVGYIGTGTGGAIESYTSGLVLTTYSTIILYSGEFYRPSSDATLPYTTTATTPDVDSNLVAVGDAVLRQDLANSGSGLGASLVSMKGAITLEQASIRAASVSEIQSYSAPTGYVITLNSGGRSGVFEVVSGDFSAELAADTGNGLFIGLADDPTASTKVARRRYGQEINPQWFGVVGEFGTDNSAALFNMRDMLIFLGRDRHWILKFPEGDYDYSNNRWLNGLLRVTIDAYGSNLRCTGSGGNSGDGWPFGPRECIFRATGEQLVSDVGFAIDLGDRINTASPGDTTIQMTTAADADDYEIGDRIFMGSYAFGIVGYSPNHRYFEWNEVTNKSGDTLTLRFPVQNLHSDEYPDFLYLSARTVDGESFPDQYLGKPRIINLDNRPQTDGTAYFYPEFLHIKGATFPQNPNTAVSYRLVLAGRKVVWEDVEMEPEDSSGITMGFDLREGELSKVIRAKCDLLEVDKLLFHTDVDGCELGSNNSSSMIGGTTTKTLSVRNTTGRSATFARALEGVSYENCSFSSVDRGDNNQNGPYMPGFPGGVGALHANISSNGTFKSAGQEDVGRSIYELSNVAAGVDSTDGTLSETFDENTYPDFLGCTPGRIVWLDGEPRVKGVVDAIIEDGLDVKVRFLSGNFPASIESGYISGTPTYRWTANNTLSLNGEIWNPRQSFEDVNTGLLDWSKFIAGPGYDVNGVELAGDGTGGIGDVTSFPGTFTSTSTYRLTYDIATTSGSIQIRDGGGSGLGTLSGTGTGLTIDITTTGGSDLEFRPNVFDGTFTPINLIKL